MDTLQTLTHGTLGIATVAAIAQIDPSNISDIMRIFVQIVVGAVTLWSMLKRKK
jgi:hypothetical protein